MMTTPYGVIVALCAMLTTGVVAPEGPPPAPPRPPSFDGQAVVVSDFEVREVAASGGPVADEFAARLNDAAPRRLKAQRKGGVSTDPADDAKPEGGPAPRYLIVGRLFTAGGSMFVAVKITDLRTGEILGKAVKGPLDGSPTPLLQKLAGDVATQLAGPMAGGTPTTLPKRPILLPPGTTTTTQSRSGAPKPPGAPKSPLSPGTPGGASNPPPPKPPR